jgi:hypothetical protein
MAPDKPQPHDNEEWQASAGTDPSQTGIVNLSESFDLSAFPSEDAGEVGDGATATGKTEPGPAAGAVELPPRASESDPVLRPALPGRLVPATDPEPRDAADHRMGPTALGSTRESDASARLIGLPPHLLVKQEPFASTNGGAGTLTLAELIERKGGLDWREAVTIVQELCLKLQDGGSQAVLLEPRNIQITETGAVRLLSGQTGGEALVVQVGRLLRTMLMGRPVPPELRLLLSQATFEVPTLHSIEDVGRKLSELEHLDDGESLKSPFARVGVPGPPQTGRPALRDATPSPRPILPTPQKRRRLLLSRAFWRVDATPQDGLLVAALVIGLAVLTGLTLSRSSSGTPQQTALPAATSGTAPAEAHGAVGSAGDTGLRPAPAAPQVVDSAPVKHTAEPSPPRTEPSRPSGGTTSRRAAPPEGSVVAKELSMTVAPPTRGGAPSPPASARETERRAAALVAEGLSLEASMAFDSLVLSNPLYEPSRDQLTPEAFAAFQASRRVLLPAIALREYDRGKAAIDGGNFDRALASGNLALSILDRIESNPPPRLREQVNALLEQATLAKLSADEIIYTVSSIGVVPPRPLSRQFPLTGPPEVPPHRVGSLEMIIGKEGDVEFVKLHTPLNRYHERMVVSAAKAWRYRPATKGGRPVRFRLTVKITLPESGTDY